MSSLKKRGRHASFKGRLIACTILVVMAPLLVVIGLLCLYLNQTVLSSSRREARLKLQQVAVSLAQNDEVCGNTMQTVLSGRLLMNTLQTWRSQSDYQLMEFRMNGEYGVGNIVTINPSLDSVRIFVNNQFPEMWPLLFESTRLPPGERPGKVSATSSTILLNQKDDLSPYLLTYGHNCIVYSQAFSNDQGDPLGVVRVSMQMSDFFQSLTVTPESLMLFQSSGGEVYCDTKSAYYPGWAGALPDILPRIGRPVATQKMAQITAGGRKYLLLQMPVLSPAGNVALLEPISDISKPLIESNAVLAAALIVMVGLLCLLFSGVLNAVLKRLYNVVRAMNQVENGDLSVRIHDDTPDEVGQLARYFSKMLVYINGLIERNRQEIEQKKDAEIRALQSQINSHFISNTIETIKMMAEIDNEDDICSALLSLGSMLRYSMGWSRRVVRLSEEIAYIEHYIALLNLRFDRQTVLTVAVQNDMLDMEVPKMTLQPIVENSVLHGAAPERTDPLLITVASARKDGYARIDVTDNGDGFSEEILARIRKCLAGRGDAPAGIGLCNVQQRIRLQYGEPCGLEVFSRVHGGTRVQILLPEKEEGAGSRGGEGAEP